MRSINTTIVGIDEINKVKIKNNVTLLTECGNLKLNNLMRVRA